MPTEVLDAIVDLLQEDALCLVCRRLWGLLGSRRYVSVVCFSDRALERTAGLFGNARSLRLTVRGPWDPPGAVAALTHAPYLHTLALDSVGADVDAAAAQALGALKDVPSLRCLTLDLGLVLMAESSAEAFGALKRARPTQALALNVGRNCMGDAGVLGLAALRGAPWLHTLTLNLVGNAVGVRGAHALAALSRAPSLQVRALVAQGDAPPASPPFTLKPCSSRVIQQPADDQWDALYTTSGEAVVAARLGASLPIGNSGSVY